MRQTLAFAGLLLAGAGIGLVLPGDIGELLPPPSTGAQSNPASQNPASGNALAALTTSPHPAAWGEDVTLQRAADGHFYADVSVDGQNTRMLVDTGASVIALTGADAEALGIAWDESEVRAVGQGANGPVYGVQTVLGEVTLGGFEARDVPALIVPEGLFVSLLGQSFLRKIRKVEISGNTLAMSS